MTPEREAQIRARDAQRPTVSPARDYARALGAIVLEDDVADLLAEVDRLRESVREANGRAIELGAIAVQWREMRDGAIAEADLRSAELGAEREAKARVLRRLLELRAATDSDEVFAAYQLATDLVEGLPARFGP